MQISELIGSTAEPDKRTQPDATPGKTACKKSVEEVETDRDGLIAAPVKNGCTNSCSAAFVKIGKAVATPVKSSCSYGFVTLAKIGYTVRVKVVYRIVPRMSDDAETIISVYPTRFPQNTKPHEYDDEDKLIHGENVTTPVKNECRYFYKVDFLTFARVGYVVRVKCLYRIGQWMADPETKSRMIMYTTILGKNARKYAIQHKYKFVHGRGAVFIILSGTLIDIVNEHIKLSKEKAGFQEQHISGRQEFVPGVEMDGKGVKSVSEDGHDWFSAAYKSLKDKVGVLPLTEILAFVVQEFRAFLRKEPFRSRIFSQGFLTMESLVFMMREFFVFMMKQLFGAQFFSHIDEIVVAVMRELFGIDLVNESGFHGSATKMIKY